MSPELIFAIFAVLAVLAILDIAIHVFSVWMIVPIIERVPPMGASTGEPDPSAEPVAISTTDGLTLRGSLYPPADRDPLGVIVFCPELDGNHWSAMRYCQGLRDAGFAVLAFDFRGQGESDSLPHYEPLHWLSEYEVEDATAVVNYVRQREDLAELPLGIMGVSRGGGAALAVAAQDETIRCVVADSAFSANSLMVFHARKLAQLRVPAWVMNFLPDWHLTISFMLSRAVSRWRRRCRYAMLEPVLPKLRHRDVLLISGERDTYVDPSISQTLKQRIGGDCEVWCVPMAKHNAARSADPSGYDARTVDVFMNMVPLHRLARDIETPGRKTRPQTGRVEQLVD